MTSTIAADLRNAALIIEHLGYGAGYFVDENTGSVCIDGALMLATTSKLHKRVNCKTEQAIFGMPQVSWVADRMFDYYEDGTRLRRYLNAQAVLIEALPDRCNADHDGCCQADEDGGLVGASRVHHYNDFVCDGAEKAVALLRMAADTLELAEAEAEVPVA